MNEIQLKPNKNYLTNNGHRAHILEVFPKGNVCRGVVDNYISYWDLEGHNLENPGLDIEERFNHDQRTDT